MLFFSTFVVMDKSDAKFLQQILQLILFVLFLSVKQKDQAGDATLLKKITGVPAFFWGAFFAGIAGYLFYSSLMGYVVGTKMLSHLYQTAPSFFLFGE